MLYISVKMKTEAQERQTTFSCWEKILPSMFIVVVLMVISMHNKLTGNQEVVQENDDVTSTKLTSYISWKVDHTSDFVVDYIAKTKSK